MGSRCYECGDKIGRCYEHGSSECGCIGCRCDDFMQRPGRPGEPQEPHNRDLTASEVGSAHGDGSDDERAGE